ncbi:hypothetical protein D3C75_1217810 [compost metagenome]
MNLTGKYIADMPFITGKQVYITENAVETPHILTFNISPVAPLQNHKRHAIAPWTQISVNIKLRRHPAALAITYKFTVYP